MSSGTPRGDTPSAGVFDRSQRGVSRPGATIARGDAIGRYLVLERLGDDGRAEVFAAYDEDLERRVTVLLFHGTAGDDPARRRAALADAQAIARVRDPNVLAVFDVGTLDARLYIATDRVEGSTLGAWLRARPRRLAQVLDALVPAARGLAALHAAGVVLGRFDAEHVLVDLEHDRVTRVRVSPFGPATAPDDRDGHPRAPAQLAAAESSAHDDQFDYCAVLFEALWGHPAFATAPAVARRGQARSAPDDRGGRMVPPALRRAVLRGLAVDPAARHPDLAALVVAIERARRRRWPLAIGGASLACLLAFGVDWGRDHATLDDRCDDGEAVIAQVWNDRSRAAIVLEAGELSAGQVEGTRARIERRLDGFAREWAELHDRSCRAAEADRDLARARDACVDDMRVHFGEVVTALTHAPVAAADADALVNDLPPKSACDRVESTVWTAVARDDARAPELLALLAELRAIGVVRVSGRAHDDQHARTQALMRRAEALGNPYVVTSVRLELALVALLRGDPEAAIAGCDRAFTDAIRSGADLLAVAALATLLRVPAVAPSAEIDIERWIAVARALLARSGPSDRLEADLALHASRLAAGRGDAELALAEHRLASEASLRALGPDSPKLGALWIAEASLLLRLGRFEEALPRVDAALMRLEEEYGIDHAAPAEALQVRAFVLDGLGRGDEALAILTEVVRRVRRLSGRETFVSSAEYNAAQLAAVHGHVAMAAGYLAASRASWPVHGEPVGESQFEFVDALIALAAGAPELCIGYAEDGMRRLSSAARPSGAGRGLAIVRAQAQLAMGRWRAAAVGLDERRGLEGAAGFEAPWGAMGVAASLACGDAVGVASSLALAESSPPSTGGAQKFQQFSRLLVAGDRSPARRAEAAHVRAAMVGGANEGDPLVRILDGWIDGTWPPADLSGCVAP